VLNPPCLSDPGRLAISGIFALPLQTAFCPTAESAAFSVNGVTFSVKLGGFILEKVTGKWQLFGREEPLPWESRLKGLLALAITQYGVPGTTSRLLSAAAQ